MSDYEIKVIAWSVNTIRDAQEEIEHHKYGAALASLRHVQHILMMLAKGMEVKPDEKGKDASGGNQ